MLTTSSYRTIHPKTLIHAAELTLPAIVILASWGLAFFEYLFQVPANRIGFKENGGPYSLVQLKTIQEAITLTVFISFTLIFFKEEKLAWNHLVGFAFLIAAVFFVFKKW